MKIIFPKAEELASLSTEDLEKLRIAGLEEFATIYPAEGTNEAFAALSDEAVADLDSLTAGLELVTGELSARGAKLEKLSAMGAARDKFATITINSGTIDADISDDGGDASATDASGAPVAATAAVETPVVLAATDGRDAPVATLAAEDAEDEKPVAVVRGEGVGYAIGSELSWDEVGKALDTRLSNFNVGPYQNAARSKRPLKTVQAFAAFHRNIPADQCIKDTSHGELRRAIDAARSTRVTRGNGAGSLIASGGWGAPSIISYDRFPKLSSQDGIATFPEIGVSRGGLQMPHGSTFAAVYASPDFISFDEDQDIAGEYAYDSSGDNVDGTKPVYRIPATTWVDHRLRVDGIHIQAGILESRGYPEGIAEETAQVMDAHAHLINSKVLATAVAGSDATTMTAGQLGAVAPVLRAVELQVLHYRDTHRMSFDTTLEMKIPFWIKGAFRDDLAKRLGVDLLDVSDQRINGFFTDRGVSLEYVYDWQSIAGTSPFTAYPTTVSFLLYSAGTWVKGGEDVISLDTMYDSTLLGTNDYTVMFTEEGWFLAKAGPDSRVITTSISPTGVTNIGDEIAASGAAA